MLRNNNTVQHSRMIRTELTNWLSLPVSAPVREVISSYHGTVSAVRLSSSFAFEICSDTHPCASTQDSV